MKFDNKNFSRFLIGLSIIFLQISCAKDADLLSEYVINDTAEDSQNQVPKNIIKIPSDFDWNNIPDDYANSVFEINDHFDLNGEVIELPANVTLYFDEGQLENGTVEGDDTLISSASSEPIVEEVTFTGTYGNEYVRPHWFGAVMDGVTDDREAFVETLAYADSLNLKVLVDRDMFLDVEETGTKSIFLEDNTWIEGANDARIIVNNLLSPAFIIALTKNITIKNLNILYDQTYDTTFGWDVNTHYSNQMQLEHYLTARHNIIFNSSTPLSRSPIAFRAVLFMSGGENVILENVSFKSKGQTADKFIQWAVKFKEEFGANQTVVNGNGVTQVPKKIVFKNVLLDGIIMGIQGIVDDFYSIELKSYRYSDLQDVSGNNIGGAGVGGDYWMPPPHLFYINSDSSTDFISKNIQILNTVDYGNYIGSDLVRGSNGYCHSLKLVNDLENVVVDNYKSYRRDGLGDWGGITNGVFRNIYAESRMEIFNPDYKFNSLRFVGELNNTTITNMTLKDLSNKVSIYPMDYVWGNGVTMDNVNIFVNELNNSGAGPFGISGLNNTVINSSLSIESHTSLEDFRAVIFQDDNTLVNGENNYYEIEVNGWRSIDEQPIEKSIRVLLANSDNTNTNYARIIDTENNLVIEQTDNVRKDVWTKFEVVTLENGTSQKLDLEIPYGFKLLKLTASTVENLIPDIEITLGISSSQKDNLLQRVSKTIGVSSQTFNDETYVSGLKPIYLYANKEFGNIGKIEVEIEFIRISEY